MPPKRSQDKESGKPAKRPKASRACVTCRKTKSRCELLDTTPPNDGRWQCHRCKVLGIECSFDSSGIIILSNGIDIESAKTQANPSNLASSSTSTPTAHPSPPPTPQPVASTEPYGVHKDEGDSPQNSFEADPEYLLLAPWRLLSVADDVGWTTSPMLAVQSLIKSTPQDGQREVYTDISLDSILPPSQVEYLIDIFESRYRPWMDLPPSRHSSMTIDIARCAIAMRHLDSLTRAKVSPRIQSLVERTLLQPGHYAAMSLEFAEALLILALWSPICGGGYEIARDNRLLATSAMEIAMNIGLGRYDDVDIFTQRSPSAPQPDSGDLSRTRLWYAATNIERLLLLGTARKQQYPRPPEAYRKDVTKAVRTSDTRDSRLVLYRRLLDLTAGSLSLHWERSTETIEKNCTEVEELLLQFNWIMRSIYPLSIVSPHDSLYFNMLHTTYHVCRLLCLHSFLCGLRRVSDHTLRHKQWMRESIDGLPIVPVWGQEYVCSTEAALVPFLSCPDVTALSTAPDNYFLLLVYAAISMITVKVSIHQLKLPPLTGSSDELIVMLIEKLRQATLSPDHMPGKCAEVVQDAYATWGRMKAEPPVSGVHPVYMQPLSESVHGSPGQEHPQTGFADIPLAAGTSGGPGDADFLSGFGEMDSGLLFDPQFWSNFLDNLKS